MIYKHESWGEAKHYSLTNNGMGLWTVREFSGGSKRTELTLSTEEKIMFEQRLKKGGWREYIRE